MRTLRTLKGFIKRWKKSKSNGIHASFQKAEFLRICTTSLLSVKTGSNLLSFRNNCIMKISYIVKEAVSISAIIVR